MPLVYGVIVIAIVVVIVVAKTATVVPQQSAYVIEHLGKYSRTLQAGFHIPCRSSSAWHTATA
jgi:regulator of protease activity HflC (stomatin/prohibitin superfamily)